jgi:ferredoxin/flavodoxin---NADP+ reductase
MLDLGTDTNPLLVAIVGSGPSGFYAAEALLRRAHVHVDMFDRLPTPFGLVRGGVAPDHPKIKQVCLVYDKIAKSSNFRFFGNVAIGPQITVQQLQHAYHAVIIACGASADRRLGIPGEDLAGSHTATEFVGWYNGHPDYQDRKFDLSHETAVVIGQGNVAADVVRILATPASVLRVTDITDAALEALADSRIRHIHIIGRRGPAQAKFTPVELKELGRIPDCGAHCSAADLTLNSASAEEMSDPRSDDVKKNVAIFQEFASHKTQSSGRKLYFRFLETPLRINGGSGVTSVTLAKNSLVGRRFAQTAVVGSTSVELECGLLFRSIGYRGVPLPGVNFDSNSGIIPNMKGRCVEGNRPIRGLYVTGWIKRGANGLIGTNRADSVETIDQVFADLPILDPMPKRGADALDALKTDGSRIVSYSSWQRIDFQERCRGEAKGKPREKFTAIDDMLNAAEQPLESHSIGPSQ